MGQCYGKLKLRRRRRRQFRHKRFDFTPKRSWKYKDTYMLNEFHVLSEQGDRELDMAEGDGTTVIANTMAIDSDEEIDTGEVRQSGRLVFSEEEEEEGEGEGEREEGEGGGSLPENHLSPSSTDPEKIGRFEVTAASPSEESEGEEEEKKVEVMVVSEKETAHLIENEAVT